MNILAFSDIHGHDPSPIGKFKDQEYDLILIAGDILPLNIQFDREKSEQWLVDVFKVWCHEWLEMTKADKVIFICGNHDKGLEKTDINALLNDNDIIYLCDNMYRYECEEDRKTYTIYGCPWLTMSDRWAFTQKADELMETYWNIPPCDILLTHCPPYGTPLAQETNWYRPYGNSPYAELLDFGNKALKKVLESEYKDIRMVICGHIHEGSHDLLSFNGTLLANVAMKDDSYDFKYSATSLKIHF